MRNDNGGNVMVGYVLIIALQVITLACVISGLTLYSQEKINNTQIDDNTQAIEYIMHNMDSIKRGGE